MALQRPTVYIASLGPGSKRVGRAFAQGLGVEAVSATHGYHGGDVFCYGMLRGLGEIRAHAREAGCNWYYSDNGYLRPGHPSGYFSVTRNAYKYNGRGGPTRPDRLQKLGPLPMPQRRGERVLVVLQSEGWYDLIGWPGGISGFRQHVLDMLKPTGRKVRFRAKAEPGQRQPISIESDLSNAWGVVHHSSAAGIKALCRGIPTFTVGWGPCLYFNKLWPNVDDAQPPDRDELMLWLARVAARQWTMLEMKTGECWADLEAIECNR